MSKALPFAFWAAVTATCLFSLTPVQPETIAPNAKLVHFVAFFGLTLLAGLAWRWQRLAVVSLALAVMGGAIEIIQAMPLVGRNGDIFDWIIDIAGIATGLLVLIAIGLGPVMLRRHR